MTNHRQKQSFLVTWADRLLGPILDRMNGWKSILGLVVALAAMILDQTNVIEPETAGQVYEIAVVVFGVGVVHKAVKRG